MYNSHLHKFKYDPIMSIILKTYWQLQPVSTPNMINN